jgi:metal-responsive CopG/Arc/MetJ family transcriptional regulator
MSPQTKTKRLGIRVDDELHQKLERLAKSQRRKVSDLIRIILEDEVERKEHPPEDSQPFQAKKPPGKSQKGAA